MKRRRRYPNKKNRSRIRNIATSYEPGDIETKFVECKNKKTRIKMQVAEFRKNTLYIKERKLKLQNANLFGK